MTDPDKAAKEARERAERARARAADAVERAERLRSRRPLRSDSAAVAEIAARVAARNDRRAHDSARAAHKQAADLQEERAGDLAGSGDQVGAQRARKRANDAREREDRAS